jgi:hypothetical protein
MSFVVESIGELALVELVTGDIIPISLLKAR